jgi:thiamine transport system ATP-binding protein
MIRLDAVRYLSEDFSADFDFEVKRGEFVAVIGPSGAGKSTLLSVIAGFDMPQSGRILLDGKDMTQTSPSQRPVTMVFQDHNTFAHLDLWTNVALGISPSLRLDAAEKRAVDGALARTGLKSLARRKPGEVSGGERQRVAIARAVIGERHLLLADEPTGALDSINGEDVIRLVRNACKRGVAGVIVTHDAQLASWADRVVFLRDGRMVDHSAPPAGPEALLASTPAR